jgi:BlaI family transcriptional regulator, penicillinase repressor
MTQRNISQRTLTVLQQKILDLVWQKEEITAEQVREGLLPEHPLKDSSVRTLLRRLEQQGYLEHRLDGKTFMYKATAPTTSHAVNAVRQLIERFWSGSAEQFIAGMVDAKVLSAEELRRLAKKVKE